VRWIRASVPVAALLLLPLLSCSAPPSDTAPAPAADGEKILRDLEAQFARSVADRDREAFLAFWAGDAAIFPETGGPAVGREKIWEHWGPVLEDADVSLTWEPSRIEMATSGDLGYTYGRYESKGKRPDGQVVTHKGCYVTIWRKEKDGAWRVVLDIGSPDPPPAAEPSGEKPAP
jgi:ketosteroid isomerase-like protein